VRDVNVLRCAIYVANNLAAGWSAQKLLIIRSPLAARLPHFLHFADDDADGAREVRLAAAWLAVNMAWLEPRHGADCGDGDAAAEAADAAQAAALREGPLRDGMLLETLEALRSDDDKDLSEQARTAIAHIQQCLKLGAEPPTAATPMATT